MAERTTVDEPQADEGRRAGWTPPAPAPPSPAAGDEAEKTGRAGRSRAVPAGPLIVFAADVAAVTGAQAYAAAGVPGLLAVGGAGAAPVDCSTTEPDLRKRGDESDSRSGGVGLLDPTDPRRSTRPVDPTARRVLTPDEARDAARRIARRQGRPVSAEQLRRALRISAATARALRDEVNAAEFGGQS